MILIADSGATKTDWRLLHQDGTVEQAKTIGFNPYFISADEMVRHMREHLMPHLSGPPQTVFYYGSGCAAPEKNAQVKGAIATLMPDAEIHVQNDVVAAARALCGHEPGIACILGTGANSCYYDGKDVGAQLPNLGFWLGDEGSGGYLGKRLLTDFMQLELPADLHEKFLKRFPGTNRDALLQRLYSEPMPSSHAASFAKFLFDNLSHPYVYQLVYDAFGLFFQKYVEKYDRAKEVPVHFVGSIAFYYANVLRQVANDRGLTLRNILETPIAGLTLYHQGEI
ncbi:hypothetical protein SAMN05421823_103700 [Catalinimonas alkaloidigena]|uniref:BadF-type ATPase n=1 Tax=Catalinimonas alkaloidigena TaxID=1075417 RepID=A0A1G9F7Y4_9BACT|nr:N-acetylglucosamine kinase [Catalinimonas alkaloidigena]SDK84509.1 hypothetical protein SAMN05421823_103700 [Catalinimonas alkaloidigena]